MHRTKWVTAAMTASLPLLLVAEAVADTGRLDRQIPAQDLEKALMCFSSARGVKLSYQPLQVRGLTTHGVHGTLTAHEELGALLAGTGLTFMITGENTVTLVGAATVQSSSPTPNIALGGSAGDSEPDALHLAQGGQGANPAAAAAGSARLDEVVVTAQKRAENTVTVPVPVTTLQASDLQNYNQLSIYDYFSQVPGLQVSPNSSRGTPQIAIRGIIAGQGLNPTVGVTIDGVPYGSSISNGGGNVVPDVDPSDLARVEVLRGPQGTLYGANSLGGLLNYVTVDPSTDKFSGRVQAGVSDVSGGDHAGYNARAAVNIPLSDDLAVRASGFTRQDPGFIDDVTHGVGGVNEAKVYGGHFAALWTPSAELSVKFGALIQHIEQFGANYADVFSPSQDLSQLTQMGRVDNTGVYANRIQNYSLTVDYKVGTLDLTSISSFNQNNVYDRFDSGPVGAIYNNCVLPTLATSYLNCGYYNPSPVPGAGGLTEAETVTVKKYTQEFRLTTALGKHVDWLFGIFYTKELGSFAQNFTAANPQTGVSLATDFLFGSLSTLQDEAVFTDFTFKINPKFDVQVGGRASKDKQTFVSDSEGGIFTLPDTADYEPYFGAPGLTRFPDSDYTSYTYLLTPRYFLLSDGPNTVMAYARFASGFRPGGPNPNFIAGLGIPETYGPDKTYNYDLGLKADLFDHRMTLDVSLFYIDWKNIQLSEVVTGGNGITVNGSRAKSQGLELQTEVLPWKGLKVDANFTYDDARLRSGLGYIDPTGLNTNGPFANAGDRLPYSAQYSGNFNVNQEFPLPIRNAMRGFVGGELSYVGARLDFFSSFLNAAGTMALPRQEYPAYTQLNLRAGATLDRWTAEIYATNVTNRRGLISGGNPNEAPTPASFYFINPLTVGLEISETF